MGIWHKHSLNKSTDENEEEVPKTFEEQVLEKLAAINKSMDKLEKRIDAIEKIQNEKIAGLEKDLRKSREYVEGLLDRLLGQHYIATPNAKSSTPSITPGSKYQGSGNGPTKLATPQGKLP